MAVLPIVTYNDPILRKYTEPVTEFDDALRELIRDMFETMYNSEGVGLAAPQVGRAERLFVMDGRPMLEEGEEEFPPTAFINPSIVLKSGGRVPLDEGCLSFPGIRETVFRHDIVKVQYINQDFEEQETEAGGWISRIIQHEMDHLNGILFIDYLSAFRKVMLKKNLEEIDTGDIDVDYPVVPRG